MSSVVWVESLSAHLILGDHEMSVLSPFGPTVKCQVWFLRSKSVEDLASIADVLQGSHLACNRIEWAHGAGQETLTVTSVEVRNNCTLIFEAIVT